MKLSAIAQRTTTKSVASRPITSGRGSPFHSITPYLMLAGELVAGWQLGRALLAAERTAAAGERPAFMAAKAATAHFLPSTYWSRHPSTGVACWPAPAASSLWPLPTSFDGVAPGSLEPSRLSSAKTCSQARMYSAPGRRHPPKPGLSPKWPLFGAGTEVADIRVWTVNVVRKTLSVTITNDWRHPCKHPHCASALLPPWRRSAR
ncbi:acyl-CoA dehydrogenase C-terminal domain-containing protein [Cupriavidus sp. CuC1]|uniref:acyl-CoA dehydrogenase C-terminal domain-containing protein n=1 Tax=Cupriavidus sp. CuC1 TaxID=3373131 RepID=UPI0037D0CFB8